jgi:D-proline reductase (dithiol) PrdB
MSVDSFKYLPRLIAAFYQATKVEEKRPIPWTPLPNPLNECKVGLVTSAGLYHRDVDPPFDIEKEKQTPTWGDPTYRKIPTDITLAGIGASHLHINTTDLLADVNIVLPLHRFHELADEGIVGSVAKYNYSFMGYQGYPPDTTSWEEIYGPQVAARFKAENVDCILLTPA